MSVRDLDAIGFQRHEWRVERVGWAAMGITILLAVLGLFSGGPLSETTSGGGEAAVEVEHERFVRNLGLATWVVSIDSSAVSNKQAQLFVSDDLAASFLVQDITPQPDSVVSTREGVTYTFAARAESPPVVKISFRPDGLGVKSGVVRAGDGDPVPMWMMIYP